MDGKEDTVADAIDQKIEKAISRIEDHDWSTLDCFSSFENLVSMGELVDRLSIINFKLYNLKNEVMRRQTDESFCGWASKQDIVLVKERSLLKRCINDKISALFVHGSDAMEEVKLYD